jgi:hypothetical protein
LCGSEGGKSDLVITNLFPGLPYTVQSSTNLASWSTYQTFTAASTNASVMVTNGPGAKMFYWVQY